LSERKESSERVKVVILELKKIYQVIEFLVNIRKKLKSSRIFLRNKRMQQDKKAKGTALMMSVEYKLTDVKR